MCGGQGVETHESIQRGAGGVYRSWKREREREQEVGFPRLHEQREIRKIFFNICNRTRQKEVVASCKKWSGTGTL